MTCNHSEKPLVAKPDPSSSSQPALKIPATFDRWFWTPEYRRGVTILFDKLRAGLRESNELIAFIRKRAVYERAYAHHLRSVHEVSLDPAGFGYDDGASFLFTYKQLCASQVNLAEAHSRLAVQLDRLVVGPFEKWSMEHEERLSKSFVHVESVLSQWEKHAKALSRLKEKYERTTRDADEAEEETSFSPAGHHLRRVLSTDTATLSLGGSEDSTLIGQSGVPSGEGYTHIGKKVGEQAAGLGRAVTQKMRIGAGRVGFRVESLDSTSHEAGLHQEELHDTASMTTSHLPLLESALAEKVLPESKVEVDPPSDSTLEKGKAKASGAVAAHHSAGLDDGESSPEALDSETPLLNIGGAVRSPSGWSRLFERARATIYKQNVKVPVIGTYPDAHSGEDLVVFFKTNIPELEGDNERAAEFCRQLSQELSILRLVGELGNKFMPTDDAFYVWKPEAFSLQQLSPKTELGATPAPSSQHNDNSASPRPSSLPADYNLPRNTIARPLSSVLSPVSPDNSSSHLSNGAGLAKYFQTAVYQAAKGINELTATVGVAAPSISAEHPGETRAERLRREAQSAQQSYAACVSRLDQTRLVLEETITEHCNFLQRCELDRLRAAKAVIIGFNAAIATLAPKVKELTDDADVLNESFSPEGDLSALVERYRTGPFRPVVVQFHSCREYDVRFNFGLDLGKWHNAQKAADSTELSDVPPVLDRLLLQLEKKYPTIPSQQERRKSWIYEVPLRAVHRLREALNYPQKGLLTDAQLDTVDAPLLAATVKLWLLELDPPPVHYSRYDDVKAIYPQLAGMETPSVDARVDVLAALLSRLPKPNLMVLDSVISHLRNLFVSTAAEDDDDDETYLVKLGLSVARSLLRPRVETSITLSDRFQPLFLVDLIKYYDRILPVAIAQKNKLIDAEKNKPQRRNTRPVDMRVRRSDLGIKGSVSDGEAHKIWEKHRRRISQLDPTAEFKPCDPVPVSADVHVSHPTSVETSNLRPPTPAKIPESPTSSSAQEGLASPSLGHGSRSPADNEAILLESGANESTVRDSNRSTQLDSPKMVSQSSSNTHPDEALAPADFVASEDGSPAVEDSLPNQEATEDPADAPFVPPSRAGSEEPADMPFVPPTKSTISTEFPRGYSALLEDDDIPLTAKANLMQHGSSNSSQNSSLSRKRGLVTARSRSSSKVAPHPPKLMSNTVPQALPGLGGVASGHKKGNPSFDSLRSQFEATRKPLGSRSELASSSPDVPLGNRYRRPGPSKAAANRLSDVPDAQ